MNDSRYREAAKDFEASANLTQEAITYNNLAWLCATAPDSAVLDGTKAVKYALLACEKDKWTDLGDLDTLAAAYARSGNYAEAMKYQKQVIAKTQDPQLISECRQRLALYRNHKPYTEHK